VEWRFYSVAASEFSVEKDWIKLQEEYSLRDFLALEQIIEVRSAMEQARQKDWDLEHPSK
jgi:hypothetical protein